MNNDRYLASEGVPELNVFEVTNKVLSDMNLKSDLVQPKKDDLKVETITFAGFNYTGCKFSLDTSQSAITSSAPYPIQEKKITPHYCPSCGATIKQNQFQCDYCLTEFW